MQARAAEREDSRLAASYQMPFKQAAEKFIKEHESTWRNLKHVNQWHSTFATYAFPIIGHLTVADIEQAHVLRVLSPIWKTKTETATRVRGHIEQILDWSPVHGHRSGPNPAKWKGLLEHVLANPNKVAPVQRHPAVPYAALPDFYQRLAVSKAKAPVRCR